MTNKRREAIRGMISRIDSVKKADIAITFLQKEPLTEDEWADFIKDVIDKKNECSRKERNE